MEAVKQKDSTQQKILPSKTVADVVCPVCFRPCEWPKVYPQTTDRYHRTTRIYYAWCFRCSEGFVVDQFERDGRWAIHRYRKYQLKNKIPTLAGGWEVLNDLPAPSHIVIGPGREFDRHIELKNNPGAPGFGALGKALAFLKKAIEPKGAG